MEPADYMLTDKVAIITGGGAGIGRGIALALAGVGADIVIAEIDPGRAEEAAERVRELGRRALAVPTDVMDTDQIRAMVAAAESAFGRVDILVNNAGGVRGGRFLEQSERSWRRHIDINLVSMLAATSAAVPIMIRGGAGAAIINAIAPDHTITPGSSGNRTGPVDESTWRRRAPEDIDAMNRLIPLGREGVVEECGNAAVFLASRMSSYITGVRLNVDGGTWASGGWVRDPEGRWTLNQGLVFGARIRPGSAS